MESYRLIVHGKVQGVFYRKFIAQKLRQMGVRGYVRNLPDGTVEVVVRATEEELEAILDVLPEGTRQIGFYSYGEISPMHTGVCDLHNQTMTLTLIWEA